MVQNPLHRRVSLLCCFQRRQETHLAQGRRALHSRRCSGGRSLRRRICTGVGRHPPQRQSTPLRESTLPYWLTLQGRDRSPLHPTCSASHGPGATSQDDNATPHRAQVVTDFLLQHGILRKDWSARLSPDLEPTQHVWDVPPPRPLAC